MPTFRHISAEEGGGNCCAATVNTHAVLPATLATLATVRNPDL